MTLPIERDTALSRKATLAKARQSRRPSRLGQRAGAAAKPDYLVAPDAGFPGLLKRVWQQATAAPDLRSAVDTLLTLAGHVPADIQLRINELLGTGRFASEEEILRAAVAALEEQNADLTAIQSGINDMENGRYRPFADFDAEFRKRNEIEKDL